MYYKNYDELPIWLIDHVLFVTDEKDIRNVTLEDINGWYELNEQRGAN
jgi:hypothetical protein